MRFEFILPDLGEGIQEGVLIRWLVQVGDTVRQDQPFAVVETDKAVVELPAPKPGVVVSLHFKPGETVKVGRTMVTFNDTRAEEESLTSDGVKSHESAQERETAAETVGNKQPIQTAGRASATPHTRAYARKMGVDLARVVATGKNGRITDEDVDRAVAAAKAGTIMAQPADAEVPVSFSSQPVSRPVDFAAAAVKASQSATEQTAMIERIPLSHLRKVIAENMRASRQISAHVTHVDEADVTDLHAIYRKAKLRQESANEPPVKLTLLPFFMKAAQIALKSHPLLNASYDEPAGEIIIKKFYNFGLAVDTPEGLIVPVVKQVDGKDMLQLAAEVADLSRKARERKLSLDELRGATFTLTNIGPIGGLFATPIIHQPELAILGLHTIKERPVVVAGQVAVRRMIYLTVSFDHRIIDGAEAARFMTDLVDLIQNPELLLVRMQ
jgi:pyruvate/2-oxoglutarate dehydrogenase complex dihydrolipoamide acyltransferase (E2) component